MIRWRNIMLRRGRLMGTLMMDDDDDHGDDVEDDNVEEEDEKNDNAEVAEDGVEVDDVED
jgi:hypothetical protein